MTSTLRDDSEISRRRFIVGSAAAGGGLALGLDMPLGGAQAQNAGSEVGIWVVIRPNNTCAIRIARSEMGQGTLTGLAQLVAEELECDWRRVTTEGLSPGQNLARKRAWGNMSTGGSQGIRQSQDYVRRGGAAARMMLLQAAANEWNVPVGELTVANGIIRHAATRRQTTYGRVAPAAAKLTPPDPKSIKLKDPKDWKIAGKPAKRLDTWAKLNGSKVYSIDLRLPGMLNAAIKDAPVYGSKISSVDDSKTAKMPGVRKVVRVKDTAIAVVADTWWQAKNALDALTVTWDEGENAKVSSASIARHVETGLMATETNGDRRNGDALAAIAGAKKKVEATYSTPFLSHACMEVNNATVRITADRAECWAPTQNLEATLAALASESGLPLAQCEVHRHDLGGGFGRRGGTQDYVRKAVVVAKEFPGVPVKTIWSREEDQAHDYFRPISMCKFAAGLDENNNPGRAARPRVGPVDQRLAQSGGDGGRSRHAPAARVLGGARQCPARLLGAESPDRVRDAQHPRSGRALAWRQHKSERLLPGMLHRGGGARRRQGLAGVPPRLDGQVPEASCRPQCRSREGRLG